MSKGIHWEWRVFGTLSTDERSRVERQCSEQVREKILTDEYLWCDGCRANIKIRKKKLKFKTLIDSTDDGCQLWQEDESSKFPFPLNRSAIERIEKELKAAAPGAVQSGWQSIEGFKAALPLFSPPLRILAIHKHRFLHTFSHQDIPFHLEIAHLLAPMERWSICIESPNYPMPRAEEILPIFKNAKDHLKLPASMHVKGYVEFLADIDAGGLISGK